MRCRILLSDSYDPWFNLATEQWIFDHLDVDHCLFLWRNDKTVVIGRSQNPWAECHLEKMQQDHVALARRQSGGGAVFHDLGNTNFTFLSRKSLYDKQVNLNIIIQALASLDIPAYASGRNDLMHGCDEQARKISGNAFKENHDRALHHGTLLLNADMSQLAGYLNPSKKKLAAKGVRSVRSRVRNLIDVNAEITHELVCAAIIDAFKCQHEVDPDVHWLNPRDLHQLPELQRVFLHNQSWDWNYGQTLPFTHELNERFAWGEVTIQLQVKNAVIEAVQIYSDALMLDWLLPLEQALVGVAYQRDDVMAVAQALIERLPQCRDYYRDLIDGILLI